MVEEATKLGLLCPTSRPTRATHAHLPLLGGYTGAAFELSGTGDPAQVNASRITAGIFSTLGVAPQLGRVFTPDEDEHHQQVAVLSYATWHSRFHDDPQIIGTQDPSRSQAVHRDRRDAARI